MTIKEIQTKTGSLTSYGWYIFLVFCWFFADNRFTTLGSGWLGESLFVLVQWTYRILVLPFLLAGVFGGIHEQQRSGEEWSIGLFVRSALRAYLQIMGASVLGLFLFMALYITILLATGLGTMENGDLWVGLLSIPYSAILLFWLTGIVVERKVFKGLFGGLRTLVRNPFALASGLVWGLIGFADTASMKFLNLEPSAALDGIRAAVLAATRVLATMYALSLYKQARPEADAVPLEDLSSDESAPDAGDRWIRTAFGFSLLSFLPVVHLIALALGIVAIRRTPRFSMRAWIAASAGGFFTLFYLFLAIGWLLNRSGGGTGPGYAFVTDVNADLGPQMVLLEQGSYGTSIQQLEDYTAANPSHHWSVDTALALANLEAFDLDGAVESFRAAAEQEPERAEFYFYYGLALLQQDQETRAGEQFQLALEHDPGLADAARYRDLVESLYEPSTYMNAVLFIVVLLILFTVHEYGHALAAWKLGDDTAQKLGRLTLNPIPHLDLFGSIILPAILLFQNAAIMFGWAKPVPVNVANFKDPRRDHMRVSFAGPAMNFFVSMICFILLGFLMLFLRLFWPETLSLNFAAPFSGLALSGPPNARWLILVVLFLKHLFYTSLVLGIFNLIPIPPLDGSWILSGMLPPRWRDAYERIRPYGFVIFLLLVVTSVTDVILTVPLALTWGVLQLVVSAMGFG